MSNPLICKFRTVRKYLAALFISALLLGPGGGCQRSPKTTISGTIDYPPRLDPHIEVPPLHYKYSPKQRYTVKTDSNGHFSLDIPADSLQLAYFTMNDQQYPLLVKPGRTLKIHIKRARFPEEVSVEGYARNWADRYNRWIKADHAILDKADSLSEAFKDNQPNNVVKLYNDRISLADSLLADTPYRPVYFQTIGTYLVKRLEQLKHRRKADTLNADSLREAIIQEAQDMNFFSLPSLQAQRAGIRDFTNAYANTFGVQDSLEKAYDRELMEYDVKRLGYDTLNSARVSVLKYIQGKQARAYARMFLEAERIGEMPLETAEPSYRDYLQKYSGQYPRYTGFLEWFHNKIKQVRPGEPAVPFSLPQPDGSTISLKDYRGKYVLLDFWASWCIPCLDEFKSMRQIYNGYPRSRFEIIAISIEEDSLQWRRALQQFNNPWIQVYGGKGFQQPTFDAYHGGGIPFYILVGPSGKIRRYNDVRPSFNLQTVLDSLMKVHPAAPPSSTS